MMKNDSFDVSACKKSSSFFITKNVEMAVSSSKKGHHFKKQSSSKIWSYPNKKIQ